jgi:hypothetical protein
LQLPKVLRHCRNVVWRHMQPWGNLVRSTHALPWVPLCSLVRLHVVLVSCRHFLTSFLVTLDALGNESCLALSACIDVCAPAIYCHTRSEVAKISAPWPVSLYTPHTPASDLPAILDTSEPKERRPSLQPVCT